MTNSQCNPKREVLEIDDAKRLQLSQILSCVHDFYELIDSVLWPSVSKNLKAMADLLDPDDLDTKASVSEWEIVALGVIVDAAWTYTNRSPSPFPITRLNQISGLNDSDFCDLIRWLEKSRRELFSPVGATVEEDLRERHSLAEEAVSLHGQATQAPRAIPPDPSAMKLEPTVVEVDESKHKQLLEVLAYVKEIHFHIDPDMYKIGVEHFDALKNFLMRSALAPDIKISSEELFLVETLVDAAWTYSYRSNGNGLPGVSDPDFDSLMKWAGKTHQAMLRSAGLPVIDLKD